MLFCFHYTLPTAEHFSLDSHYPPFDFITMGPIVKAASKKLKRSKHPGGKECIKTNKQTKKASPEAFVTQFYNKKDNCSNNHRKKLLQSNGKNSDADGRDTKKERLCEHKRKEAAQPVLAMIKGNELLHSQVHSAHIYHSSVSAV